MGLSKDRVVPNLMIFQPHIPLKVAIKWGCISTIFRHAHILILCTRMHQDNARQYPSKRPGREGLSVSQISKVLGCEEAAVMRSLARGGLGDGEDREGVPSGMQLRQLRCGRKWWQ